MGQKVFLMNQPKQYFIDMRHSFSKSGVPPNSVLFGGTVPPNSVLFGGTVPPNSVLFGGAVPPNSFPHFGNLSTISANIFLFKVQINV